MRDPNRTYTSSSVMATLLVVCLVIATAFAQSEDLSSTCRGAQNCGDCISVNPSCAWCTTDTFSGQRCDTYRALTDAGCVNITNPRPILSVEMNRNLSNTGAELDDIVQVKPQRIRVRVRPNEPYRVRLEVRQAEDYPVDLYYAMDLSHSMNDDLQNLKNLGTTLVDSLGNITRDYKLGFGSFVDKTVLPYVSTVPSKLVSPCSGCARPHGFHNILPLDTDSQLFSRRLQNTIVSGNLDTPEGGFDALMQIAVCGNVIGWRPKARHLVLFTTDASFHFAGDGRMGGIVEPNDGRCHMDPGTNMYTWSTLQDYPSIGHLSAKLRENNVIPIFAVTRDQKSLYSNLPSYIEGATVGELASDSGNIVDLIKENYQRITSQVKLTSTAPDTVNLMYTANCLSDTYPDSSECSELKLGQTVSFDIDITAEQCIGRTNFTVGPVGFNEELVIELEVTCECECSSLSEQNSPACTNGNGTLICGECECNPDRYGTKCECGGSDISLENSDQSPCRMDNTSRICSGRGECICGKCICDNTGNDGEKISGRFCECDNFNCPYSRGLRCGGPDRGQCVCDVATGQPKCQCFPGFTGDSCDCPTTTKTCEAANGLECNAHGTCVCGVCECFSDSQFQGRTCEKCPTCPLGECHVHRECVQCMMFGTGRLTPEQCEMCTINIVNVSEILDYKYLTSEEGQECTFTDENNTCTFTFALVYENETLTVYVESNQTCAMTQNPPLLSDEEIRWVVIGIIAGIVLIGMIIVLAWRLYTHLQYLHEYNQWQKECQKANWDKSDNPIYKSSTTHYQNPVYGK